MKKPIGLVVLVTLAACAPAAGRPAVQMLGATQAMVNAAVAACPAIAPANYNFLSVDTIGDNFVSCSAEVTAGIALLDALGDASSPEQKLGVSFSAVGENVVQVAVRSSPRNTSIEDQLETALRAQFSVVSLP